MKCPLLVLAACFAMGILAAHLLDPDFAAISLLLATASVCLLLGLISLRRERILISACLALAGFVLAGTAAGAGFQYRFLRNDVHNLSGWGVDLKRSVETEGVLVSNPIRSHNSIRFDLECRRIEYDNEWRKVRGKIQVRLFAPADSQSWVAIENLDLRYGNLIQAPVRFEKPRMYRNPGSFNFRWWLEAINDISWEGTIGNSLAVRKISESQVSPYSLFVQNIRSRLLNGIDHLYPPWSYEGRVGAVLKAVLLGDRSSLDTDTVENFRQSGLYHLLVIAGLHVGLLASVLLFFLYLLRVGETWRAAWLLTFLGTYLLLVEQRAPTLRASLMIAAYLLGRYLYRDRSALNAVGIAALVLLFYKPAWLFEAGFDLSFSAALLIAGLALPILQRTTIPYRSALFHLREVDRDINLDPRHAQFRVELRMILTWLKAKLTFLNSHPTLCELSVTTPFRAALWVIDLVFFSSILQLGLLMPMAETFHRITIVGIGLNTVAFPLMAVLIAVAVPTVILAAVVPPLAVLPGKLLFWVTHGLLALTEFRGEPLWMSYRIPGPPAWVALGFALAVVGVTLTLRRRRALLVFVCLFSMFTGLVVSYPFPARVPKAMIEVTALDCGRGEALFGVLPDGTTLLVDAGGRESFGPDIGRWNPGEEIVSPYLWSRGIKKIDIAVLGGANGENISAMTTILRNFTVGELWHSSRFTGPGAFTLIETARERNVRIRNIAAGGSDGTDKADIQVLWPSDASQNTRLPSSDRVPVLRIVGRDGGILLCGTTDDRVERILAASAYELSSDVVESARPLAEITGEKKFLARVDPSLVLETGGHETVEKGRRHLGEKTALWDVPVFNTANEGAVTIDLKNSALSVRCYGTSRIIHLQRSTGRAASASGL
ncbi:MAG TPA: ComEC/Rec2 family competence protein [Terriglobia bacterium]|nr:ComEC/Rec2 family competence protein [Terriglobia bacterium]